MAICIKCEDVSFSYEGHTVVSGIDFKLEQGDYLCIVGENGTGKSTLIKGILKLKQPCNGIIERMDGLDNSSIGYMPQQNTIQRSFPASVLEVVLSGRLGSKRLISFYNQHDRAVAHEVMEKLDLWGMAKSSFGELSGGQQQRVLLARALAASSDRLKLLILDEPMSALDPHIKQETYEFIRNLNVQGLTIIMVTHDVNTAVTYANKMLLLSARQEFFGTSHEFQHTELGRELMRDSCGGHCAVCGLAMHEGGD